MKPFRKLTAVFCCLLAAALLCLTTGCGAKESAEGFPGPAAERLIALGVPAEDLEPFPEELLEDFALWLEGREFHYFRSVSAPAGLADSTGDSVLYLAADEALRAAETPDVRLSWEGEQAWPEAVEAAAGRQLLWEGEPLWPEEDLAETWSASVSAVSPEDLELDLLAFVVMEEDDPAVVEQIRCLAAYRWQDASGLGQEGQEDTFALYFPDSFVAPSTRYLYVETAPLGWLETEEDRYEADSFGVLEDGCAGAQVPFRADGSGCFKMTLETDGVFTLEDLEAFHLWLQYTHMENDSWAESSAGAAVLTFSGSTGSAGSASDSGCEMVADDAASSAGSDVTYYIENSGSSYRINGYDATYLAWNPPDGDIVTDGWHYYANPYFWGSEFAKLSIEGNATWADDVHSAIEVDFTEKSELDDGGTVTGPVTRFTVDAENGILLSYEGIDYLDDEPVELSEERMIQIGRELVKIMRDAEAFAAENAEEE